MGDFPFRGNFWVVNFPEGIFQNISTKIIFIRLSFFLTTQFHMWRYSGRIVRAKILVE